MNIYAQLIRELKKERARINYRIRILESWVGKEKIRKKRFTQSEAMKKNLSKRMKEVWARKRKEKANERN